ncbi:hypothetical protein HK101_010032 [Irineochytrium annulatum]|nr:hypothetical protein HK101_010032 [Irineochytrium annulatum]
MTAGSHAGSGHMRRGARRATDGSLAKPVHLPPELIALILVHLLPRPSVPRGNPLPPDILRTVHNLTLVSRLWRSHALPLLHTSLAPPTHAQLLAMLHMHRLSRDRAPSTLRPTGSFVRSIVLKDVRDKRWIDDDAMTDMLGVLYGRPPEEHRVQGPQEACALEELDVSGCFALTDNSIVSTILRSAYYGGRLRRIVLSGLTLVTLRDLADGTAGWPSRMSDLTVSFCPRVHARVAASVMRSAAARGGMLRRLEVALVGEDVVADPGGDGCTAMAAAVVARGLERLALRECGLTDGALGRWCAMLAPGVVTHVDVSVNRDLTLRVGVIPRVGAWTRLRALNITSCCRGDAYAGELMELIKALGGGVGVTSLGFTLPSGASDVVKVLGGMAARLKGMESLRVSCVRKVADAVADISATPPVRAVDHGLGACFRAWRGLKELTVVVEGWQTVMAVEEGFLMGDRAGGLVEAVLAEAKGECEMLARLELVGVKLGVGAMRALLEDYDGGRPMVRRVDRLRHLALDNWLRPGEFARIKNRFPHLESLVVTEDGWKAPQHSSKEPPAVTYPFKPQPFL